MGPPRREGCRSLDCKGPRGQRPAERQPELRPELVQDNPLYPAKRGRTHMQSKGSGRDMDQGATTRPTADDLKTQIRSWDSPLSEDSDEFEAALVMLAALYIGTGHGTSRRLTDFTGVPHERTLMFQRRLRAAGIWQDGRTVADWNDPRSGEAAFWLDVGVAAGTFELKERRAT